jgi:hypothetical protein
VNDLPLPVADNATTAEDSSSVVVDAKANDAAGPANESGQTLAVASVSDPPNGTASVIASGPNAGKVQYTPDADYNGADTFTYSVCDNGTTNGTADPKCATGSVNITVWEVNDRPVPTDDTLSTAEDTVALLDVRLNDAPGPANESGQTLAIGSLSDPANGTASLVLTGPSAGKVQYVPDANAFGADSFTYGVCDNGTTNGAADLRCANASVSVTVSKVNDPPQPVDDTASTLEDEGARVIDVTPNDVAGPPNEVSQVLSLSSVTAPLHGTAEVIASGADAGKVRYTSAPDYFGSDSFTYTVCDNGTTNGAADPRCASATVNVTVAQDTDDDRVPNETDNCDLVANPLQEDNDLDDIGDACDPDDDNDTFADVDELTHGSLPLDAASTPEGPTADGAFARNTCDGLDNDLDAVADEGFVNTDGDSQADCVDLDDDNDSFSDVDELTYGSNPIYAESTPEGPAADAAFLRDTCDGLDNDLDTSIDEGLPNNDAPGGLFGGTQAWIPDGSAAPEAVHIGCDSIDLNDDNDSCTDAEELGGNIDLGGTRDPANPWDFADVPAPALPSAGAARNGAVTLTDVGATLDWVGRTPANGTDGGGRNYTHDNNANGILDGAEYDRIPAGSPEGTLSGPPNGAISMSDVGVVLIQVGDNCTGAPN